MTSWKTLAKHEALKKTPAHNNFLYIRLLASTMVVFGHSIVLSKDFTPELIAKFSLFGFTIHGVGVLIFFCLSGYLVTGSICQRKSIPAYIAARAIRIFPGLTACVVASTILSCLLLSSMTPREFINHPLTWTYVLHNVTLYQAEFNLPGISHTINGSLWTIPIEARLYLVLIALWVLSIPRSGIMMLIASALMIYAALHNTEPAAMLGEANYRLIACFFIGGSLYSLKSYIPMNMAISVAIFTLTCLIDNQIFKSLLFFSFIGYTTLLIAYARKIREVKIIEDYSYGIYLYAFFIQMTILHYTPDISATRLALISIPASWICGAISWHIVEKPCLSLKRRFGGAKRTTESQYNRPT